MPEELKKLSAHPVWIEWVDSIGTSGWCMPSGHPMSDLDCLTLGFLIWETDEAVCVAASVSATGRASDPVTIPRCAIKKFEEVQWSK